jgi:23S rRNA (cytidine1920-2'-O)/16S rRNA (cytidine1409-2'-O)-methyltransferase
LRLDQLLVQRGLYPSREKARRAVMAGLVAVDGRRVDKPGTAVKDAAALAVEGPAEPFASRAGRKLEAALDHFGVDPGGRVCLDVGASTGGFTDCLLQRGARRVYAVDVGYGQLDYRLRQDPRVVVMERVNARHLGAGDLPEPVDLTVIDVSFISLLKVVPALLPYLAPGGELLALVKPQFEAGRGAVGKGGILRDEAVRRRTIDATAAGLAALGLGLVGVVDSEVAGAGGNREAFALLRKVGAVEPMENGDGVDDGDRNGDEESEDGGW